MAWVAQRDEVSEIICFHVAVDPEGSEGLDVMNVKARLLTTDTAEMPVPLPRRAIGHNPRWAVIERLTAFPIRIVHTCSSPDFGGIRASSAAVVISSKRRRNREGFSTKIANLPNWLLSSSAGVILHSQAFTAITAEAASSRRAALEDSTALLTYLLNALSSLLGRYVSNFARMTANTDCTIRQFWLAALGAWSLGLPPAASAHRLGEQPAWSAATLASLQPHGTILFLVPSGRKERN